MIRPVMIIAAFAVAVGAVGAASGLRKVVAHDAKRAVFSEACEHYRTRAEAGSGIGVGAARRAATGDFVVFLAGACDAAEGSLDTGTSKQRARAALLLSRIVLLRETIGQMNVERANASGGAGAFPRFTVTSSGEFLIAHRMGLMIAFDAWLDTGVDFSLAFSR